MHAAIKLIPGIVPLLALVVLSAGARAEKMPDNISLDSLENLYEHVQFNHARHIELIRDCGECHHHTTGTLVQDANCVRCHKNSEATGVVACKGCHKASPFSADALKAKDRNAYHQDIPGLKGAYHMSCTGCHKKMGGPVGCKDCHPRNQAGDARFNAGRFAPGKGSGEGKHSGH